MIELNNIDKYYNDIHALKKISLTVKTGEIFGIIGTSGAGKSTLVRCVNLLERPESGQVLIDGQNLITLSSTQLNLARRKISMIFQHFNLMSTYSVYQNIALPLKIAGINAKEIEQRITPLIALTGLKGKESMYPTQLSGGQKQRIAIARALATEPKILLCDEATSALDPQTTQSILELLAKINQQLNLTILLITHEMSVIKDLCDQVAVIENGELIEQKTVLEFFARPQTQKGEEFVNSCLLRTLPPFLTETMQKAAAPGKKPIIRFYFHGETALQPLITSLVKELGWEINILQANLEYIKQQAIGVMISKIENDINNFEEGIALIKKLNMHVEILGYVE